MNYDNLTREELIAVIQELSFDRSFGIIKKERGILDYGNIVDGTDVIYIDLANVHAANHLYTMDGYDSFVRNVTAQIKHEDVVIKFGGDEIVIIPRNGTSLVDYIARLNTLLKDNNIYAVIASTKSINGLCETVKYLDAIVSAEKTELEATGKKPARDQVYTVRDSSILMLDY
jgi:hypothetical protein